MEILKYNIKHFDKIVLFEFELTKNLEPNDLSSIKLPDTVKENIASFLVILSGIGPIWFYAFMVHRFHPCKAIAILNPGLEGEVVVETHANEFKI